VPGDLGWRKVRGGYSVFWGKTLTGEKTELNGRKGQIPASTTERAENQNNKKNKLRSYCY